MILFYYNKAIKLRTLVDEAWSGIDVHLRERRNVIPALVEVVKAYSSHEKQTLENTVAQRNTALDAAEKSKVAEEENNLTQGVVKIFALAEAYPELKASENFKKLQQQIVEIEDKLQYSRRYHNGTVRDYNTFIQSIPFVFFKGLLNFKKAEFFEIKLASEKSVPNVSLS